MYSSVIARKCGMVWWKYASSSTKPSWTCTLDRGIRTSFQSHAKTFRSTEMIWLTQRALVTKLPTILQFSNLLIFLVGKQIQEFNSLITEIGFLQVDFLMKNAYPFPNALNTSDCWHNFSEGYAANFQPWHGGIMAWWLTESLSCWLNISAKVHRCKKMRF